MGFFQKLKEGLSKTRNSISKSFSNLFKANEIDDDFYDQLEETLVMADMGYETSEKVIDDVKAKVKELKIKDAAQCKELIINSLRDQMDVDDSEYDFEEKKSVIFVIGVNGVGKTTSIGKLAAQYHKRGKKVLIAAADTFRAAAIDQLKTWADRAEVDIIAQSECSDPSAVAFYHEPHHRPSWLPCALRFPADALQGISATNQIPDTERKHLSSADNS